MGGTQWFISRVDICSDAFDRLTNSDLVVHKMYRFLRQNFSSKFRYTEKLIDVIKIAKKKFS